MVNEPTRKDAGIVTAYGAAVRGGYTGTYEEFCRQQANYAEYAQAVEEAKEAAQEAAGTAQTAAGTATAGAESAGASADDAIDAAAVAVDAAASARQDKEAAAGSATAAAGSATAAGQAKTAAEGAATAAGEAQTAAEGAATAAGQAKTAAESAATAAGQSKTAAESAAGRAEAAMESYAEMTAEAETLAPGAPATAEIDRTGDHPVLKLGTPTGTQGPKGEAGTSPSVTVTDITGGHRVTITDDDGDHTFDVMNGIDGTGAVDSVNGKAGAVVLDGRDINVNNSVQNPETVADALGDLKSAINDKAPVIISSASGAIVSFPDGADDMPIKSLKVGIEPVQDLHGYDHPWPAGGGKNLLDPSLLVAQETWKVVKIPLAPGTYTMSTNYAQSDSGELGMYFRKNESDPQGSSTIVKSDHPVTRVIEEGDIPVISFRRVSGTITFDDFDWQIESGSIATEYAPYSNICPITGWTMVNLYRAGQNLEDAQVFRFPFPSEAGVVYGGTLDVVSGELVVDRAVIELNGQSTIAGGLSYQRFYIALSDYTSPAVSVVDSIVSDTFKTVTNGTLHLNDWSCSGSDVDSHQILFRFDETFTSVELVREYLSNNPIEICYPLATPIIYHLTPQEVKTLLGQNNIWADTGDTEAEYPADTKLYIQNLTKPTEDDMTANVAIQSGKFFMINNRLFLATAAIAVGATIIPGTNCSELSLADALNNINA